MSAADRTVLVVGATGSIGRVAVAEALSEGYAVRALVRDTAAARRRLPEQAQLVTGDLLDPRSLAAAVDGADAIVFTHGASSSKDAEGVDYGGVRNVLQALNGRRVHIVLMTAIGVTKRTVAHDWKRRGERLVRASGLPYTIVRPGWFDYNDDDQHQLALLQGDRRHAGTPADGAISRRQLAQVLVQSIAVREAVNKTVELVAERGPATRNFAALFANARQDAPASVDGIDDLPNLVLEQEPESVQLTLQSMAS